MNISPSTSPSAPAKAVSNVSNSGHAKEYKEPVRTPSAYTSYPCNDTLQGTESYKTITSMSAHHQLSTPTTAVSTPCTVGMEKVLPVTSSSLKGSNPNMQDDY